jgi:fructose-1,6-bisphosphatase/inositol monophosphatase family enzyme
LNGQVTPVRRSAITDVSRAVLCVNGLSSIPRKPYAGKMMPFFSRFWSVRSLGGALDAMHTCAGLADFWIESSAKPWDVAVMQVIAHEAGVCFFDSTGTDTIYGGDAILCVPALEPVARELLGLPERA